MPFEASKADLAHQFHELVFRLLRFLQLYALGEFNGGCLGATRVHRFDIAYGFDAEGVLAVAVREDIPHQVPENIFFDQQRISFLGIEHVRLCGEMLERVQVGVQFIVQATFQPAALAAQFGLVDGEVLVAGDAGGDALEIREPAAAA